MSRDEVQQTIDSLLGIITARVFELEYFFPGSPPISSAVDMQAEDS